MTDSHGGVKHIQNRWADWKDKQKGQTDIADRQTEWTIQ